MIKKLLLLAALAACTFAQETRKWRLDDKVVGGDPVKIESYPYQVSLQRYDHHICGAAIISKRFVLTAAHCTYGATSTERYSIYTGVSNLDQPGTRYTILRWFEHPEFNKLAFSKDITVIELTEDIVFDATRQPIALPSESYEPIADTPVVLTGWGATYDGGHSIKDLQKVEVGIIGHERCKELYKNFKKITEYMICAGTPTGGKDACQGDSGGPLVANGQLVGIVSWGRGCARPKSPGVYTHVAKLRSYIQQYAGF